MSEDSACKICYDSTGHRKNPLINPCNCRGSIQFVHKNCLEHWISASKNLYCTECKVKYKLIFRDYSIVAKNIATSVFDFLLIYGGFHILFNYIYPQTYVFTQLNIFEHIVFSMWTTYCHLGLCVSYFCAIMILIVSVIGIISEFVSLRFHPVSNISWITGYLSADYPHAKAITKEQSLVAYTGFFFLTIGFVYCMYRITRKNEVYIQIRS
jgi:hypothetical protein